MFNKPQLSVYFLILFNIMIAGCKGAAMDDVTRTKVEQIAKKYLHDNHPDWLPPTAWEPYIEDKGDVWEFSYRLPQGVVGGAPVVEVDKKTTAVVKAFHTQ